MAHIVVQADDLSGAAETAYSFVQQGLRVRLVLDDAGSTTEDADRAALDVDVLVHDSHSRGLSGSEAQERAAAVFRNLPVGRGVLAFKKFDSLWRGNIRAEIAAITEAGHHVVVAGALPHLGRSVVDSQPLVDGQPLVSTDHWQAEIAQPPTDVRSLLDPEDPRRVRQLGLSALREGSDPALLPRLLDGPGPSIVVVDSETEEDLHLIVAMLLETGFTAHGRQVVLAGTGATAAALARSCAPPSAHDAERRGEEPRQRRDRGSTVGPVLAVVGSASGPAREQVHRLEDRGFLLMRIRTQEPIGADTVSLQLATCRAALAAGLHVAVTTAETRIDPTRGPSIVRHLAHFAAQAAAGPVSPDLLLTGGETAREVLVALGHHRLTPLAATHHGAVLSQAADGTLVGTKPGSFGNEFALVGLYELLTEQDLSTVPHTTSHHRPSPPHLGATMTTTTDTTTAPESLPLVAVTMGDGAGVGPEVVVAAVLDPQSTAECRPVVIGDAMRLRQAAEVLGVTASIVPVDAVDEAVFEPGRINVIDLGLLPEDLAWGRLSPVAGHAAYEYIRVASELAMAGEVQAICTAPLNKEALHAAGHIYPGHTELLAHLTGTEEVSMMLSTPKIRVIHVTTHIGLVDAIRKINPDLVERTIRRGHEALVRAGIPAPKIGVCAINPHAGENGLFGQGEEAEKIAPGVQAAAADGIDVTGPLPADTLFFLAGRGDYDLVVAMYHDQGHGPVKVLGIEAGVNVTVGLPVIRTSVDHGTAFDIAGKAIADSRSMVEALHQASEMATRPSVAA